MGGAAQSGLHSIVSCLIYTRAEGREGMLMVVNSAMRCKDGRQMSRLHGALDSTWSALSLRHKDAMDGKGLHIRLPVLREDRSQWPWHHDVGVNNS